MYFLINFVNISFPVVEKFTPDFNYLMIFDSHCLLKMLILKLIGI